MPRWFNTAGPCQSDIHYMLPALNRLPPLERLIAQRGYFVIHAPRQTGKTTAMLALAQQLTEQAKYAAVMVSAEQGRPFSHDPGAAENAILEDWQSACRFALPEKLRPPTRTETSPGGRIRDFLQTWAEVCPRPIVLFIDEIDALQGEALVSVLCQLQAGYPRRPRAFPQSVALIGLRDVRDYKVASGGVDHPNSESPFNIKIESLTLKNFTPAETAQLYAQHTTETGQAISPDVIQWAYELTQGQPWLVNALARQMVEEISPDPTFVLTVDHVNQAKERLIRRQDTHFDSLVERLKEARVRDIIQPMLTGKEMGKVTRRDIQFLIDTGLCVMDSRAGLTIANPIYREVCHRC